MDVIQFGHQDNAFLLVGIRPSNHRDKVFGCAGVVRLVRHIGGDIDKVSSAKGQMLFKLFAVPAA